MRREVHAKAELAAEERVIDALVGTSASAETRQKFRKMLREGALAEREIEVELTGGPAQGMPTVEVPGMPGAQMGMIAPGEQFGKAVGATKHKRRLVVHRSCGQLGTT